MTDWLSGENLYRDVVSYHRMSDHRTGGEGDAATTEWVATELGRAGLKVDFQDFSLRQFAVGRKHLYVAGEEIACFPWWYPRATGPKPVTGPLVSADAPSRRLAGSIVLLTPGSGPPDSLAAVREQVAALAAAGARAVLAVSRGPSGRIVAINTADDAAPWPVPVMLVARDDEDRLVEAAHAAADTSLLVEGEDIAEARSRNVFGRHDAGNDFIVVSTPTSGWFDCGGERGPGVALALALARWVGDRPQPVAERRPPASYWFDFNSGHERLNLGTRLFLQHRAPPPERVRCWLHLGANIATWDHVESATGITLRAAPEKYPVVCSGEDTLAPVAAAFAGSGVAPYVGPGIGELGPVLEAGYRGFGVYGGRYRYFHTPGDGPEGTAPELLEPVARATARALMAVE
ncbi:MAG: hypothetical protein V3S10_01915 [Dehalococcoidales bacterium]